MHNLEQQLVDKLVKELNKATKYPDLSCFLMNFETFRLLLGAEGTEPFDPETRREVLEMKKYGVWGTTSIYVDRNVSDYFLIVKRKGICDIIDLMPKELKTGVQKRLIDFFEHLKEFDIEVIFKGKNLIILYDLVLETNIGKLVLEEQEEESFLPRIAFTYSMKTFRSLLKELNRRKGNVIKLWRNFHHSTIGFTDFTTLQLFEYEVNEKILKRLGKNEEFKQFLNNEILGI